MRKEFPNPSASVEEIIKGIAEKKFYVETINLLKEKGFEEMTVGITTTCFSTLKIDRYTIQEIEIPESKKGNLKKYAGQKVQIIATVIPNRTQSIKFFIKKIN
jgi:hypothetical protein